MIQLTKNFSLEEFMPPEIMAQYGANAIWFLDPKIPLIAQAIRDIIKVPMYINTWATSGPGQFKNRGFRNPFSAVGGKLSQHKFGRAFDFHSDMIDPVDMRIEINTHFEILRPLGLTTIEMDTPSWTHIDCRAVEDNTKLLRVPYK